MDHSSNRLVAGRISLRKIHRTTGLFLSVFVFFHVINHLFGVVSADLHQETMSLFRLAYRNVFVESILLFAVSVQIVVGIALVIRKQFIRSSLYDKLQIISGLYLSFFMIIHVSAVLVGRYVWKVETDFHFAAYGVKHSPSAYFFVPYYFLSVFSVFAHIAAIHKMKISELKGDLTARHQSRWIILAGGIISALILVGLYLN